ncbi:hypothetical protein B0H13DRAFT_1851003 [Mycena leptocephala]|nr:hypothetical protein B0H13DRAFT_1851003 [Mycena leptocephala]
MTALRASCYLAFPLGLLPHGFLAARGTLFASCPEAVASHCLKWFIINLGARIVRTGYDSNCAFAFDAKDEGRTPRQPPLAKPLACARGGHLAPSTDMPRKTARGGSLSPDFGHAHGQTPMTETSSSTRRRPAPGAPPPTKTPTRRPRKPPGGHLTPAEAAHHARVYCTGELGMFHCERVHKVPVSWLDRSMPIGFVCRNEAELIDFRKVGELHRTMFRIQDEPPPWPGADDDDDMGLDSVSDPEETADPGIDNGDVSHSMANSWHVVACTFSHTHTGTNLNSSNSTTSSRACSSEVLAKDDWVGAGGWACGEQQEVDVRGLGKWQGPGEEGGHLTQRGLPFPGVDFGCGRDGGGAVQREVDDTISAAAADKAATIPAAATDMGDPD